MTLFTFDVGDKTDAASVMFIGRIVQTLRVHKEFSTAIVVMTLKDSSAGKILQLEQIGSELN
jgi:hypothetical protein